MKKVLHITLVCLLSGTQLIAQESDKVGPSAIISLAPPRIVPSIAKQIENGTLIAIDPDTPERAGMPKRSGANMTVPGKGLPKDNDALVGLQQRTAKHQGREPLLVFDANTVAFFVPSDPTGAVGPNHYLGGWNVGFRIFDKQGQPLTPEAWLSTIFPGNDSGDPIMLYDVHADRYIITQFDFFPFGVNFAISAGPDPVNDDWYVYTAGLGTDEFPDYPKFSIWSDGYYITANISSTNNRVFVIEREKVLNGEVPQFLGFPLPGISTSGFYSPQFFNVTNGDLPPPGGATVVYLQDDAWSQVNVDHLKLWTLDVDWQNPSNSTISQPAELITTPFISVFDGGSFSNRPQPSGPDIDVLQAIIMQQAQYRRWADYNSAIFNFVVDTDASSNELAGIRWYELRQYGDGEPWEIYQEGTYISPNNGKDAFSGSMAMDGHGNIGMAYTTVSSQESIAIYYTGRYANDPPGVMTIDETLIKQGNSNNPDLRLADYVHLTLDPEDDKTFWHIAEYFNNNLRTNVVGVFRIAPDLAFDVGMLEIIAPADGLLSEDQEITVRIFNYGTTDQEFIPLSYFVHGGDTINEIYPGFIPSGQSADYTFNATTDMGLMGQTYSLTVYTSWTIDENPANDTITANVRHLYPHDIGIQEIIKPESGTWLSGEETVAIRLRNFGAIEKSDLDLSYELNGITVTESFTDILLPGSSVRFDFDAKADFYNLGTYELKAYTSLEDDYDLGNDTITAIIVNSNCMPGSDCNDGKSINYFELANLSNETDCSETGYSDFTNMIATLESGSTHDLILSVGVGGAYLKVWIDFNDNFIFEADEVIVDNHLIMSSFTEPTDTIAFTLGSDVMLGEHLMRLKVNWDNLVPENACESSEFGETEDYKVNLVLPTGMTQLPEIYSRLEVRPYGNKQFEVSLITEQLKGFVLINLHNSLGYNLVENKVAYLGDRYTYHLDMSYASPGVYFVRMGTYKYGKVVKFVVQ